MNRLSREKRAQILHLLVEGMSMRSTSRVVDVSVNTVMKLLVDAGRACHLFHEHAVRGVRVRLVQADEIWDFTYMKEGTLVRSPNPPTSAGDTWTWTAIDPESKLLIAFHVGRREASDAFTFMADLEDRLGQRVQLTTDGLPHYQTAVAAAFGEDVDYNQLIKTFGNPYDEQEGERRYSPRRDPQTVDRRVMGNPDPEHVSTSIVERHNLTMRMQMRRMTRLTNAFSKKVANHLAMVAVYAVWYNFCRIHGSLRVTPAMAAGLDTTVHDMEWMVGLIEDMEAGRRPGTRYRLLGVAGRRVIARE
ncbi:MAG: DDE-type integrase/transposase/recombinase [Rhodothermaceae bacterium]|nr:DDE-type integrase/transposase/recombinase [Rhodothermaceae bacterium]